ncbi:MAG: hypothetical protein E7374_00205 [Clostridiales bacterium]|nr:hypothetical protein [Clostridiales bacterium]
MTKLISAMIAKNAETNTEDKKETTTEWDFRNIIDYCNRTAPAQCAYYVRKIVALNDSDYLTRFIKEFENRDEFYCQLRKAVIETCTIEEVEELIQALEEIGVDWSGMLCSSSVSFA